MAVLGAGVVAPNEPIIRADDLGVLRGDGIFETMHIRAGEVWMLDDHLKRMASSAQRLELDLPAEAELRALIEQVLAAWPTEIEGGLRLVCTRGPEHGGPPTVFATATSVDESSRRARHDGISVRTTSLGVTAAARTSASPCLLAGAKTISYAVNMAARRWAKSEGADDVLWVSTDGYALEGPTSNLVWRRGATLYTVPPAQTGILAGTTARHLLDRADALGFASSEEMVKPEQLLQGDGAWFTSSVRGLAAIHTLDGSPLKTEPELTGRMLTLLGFA